jgi:hypothetical protein
MSILLLLGRTDDAHCNVGSAQFQVSLYNNVD